MLFICNRNQWRSPTAEKVFAGKTGLRCRSRGLSNSARRRLRPEDLAWADLVFVMTDAQAERMFDQHREALGDKLPQVLDIPDEYRFMDPELVECLHASAGPPIAAALELARREA